MKYVSVRKTLRREWPNLVLAVRGTQAALLALAVIGRCLQQLKDNESNGNRVTVTADPVLETSHRLSVAAQQPAKILALLESLAFRLWQTVEHPCLT